MAISGFWYGISLTIAFLIPVIYNFVHQSSTRQQHTRGNWYIHDNLQISNELLQHLQSNMDFMELQENELTDHGFFKCVDQPALPNHIYYEGYFHALHNTSCSIKSMNPRTGKQMNKPAAPLALRAFITSFKQLNNIWIQRSVQRTFIEELNLSNNLFIDCSVQIHFGDEMANDYIVYHYDAINSILHLAISIHGERALYYIPNEGMVNIQNNKDKIKMKWQTAGSCYLSSTFAFIHAVEYPKTLWKQRIIAIQCRLLLSVEQYKSVTMRWEQWGETLTHITNQLKDSEVIIPSLQEVLEMEQNIKEHQVRLTNDAVCEI